MTRLAPQPWMTSSAASRVFAALEDEMCSFGAPGFIGSPDRLDALVWAITELMLVRRAPYAVRSL